MKLPIPVESFPRRIVPAGEIVFLEGQPGDQAYVILKGEVEVAAQGDAETRVVTRMKPGEIFGEIALLHADGKRTATVVSRGGCELLVVDRHFFDDAMSKADPLLRYVIELLCDRLASLTGRVAQKGFGDEA
ncbi:MAG: cyclic nucleotide-binding domain-containing protein [Rhodospirillaceae bacterium]